MTGVYVATGPFVIARLSNKKTDAPSPRYLWVGFTDLVPRRFYDPRRAVNTYGHEHVLWSSKGGFEYGGDNLTDEGRALYEAIAALSKFAGAIKSLWLPWDWRDEFGDMVRIEIDMDEIHAIVEHIMQIVRDLYGDDVQIIDEITPNP